MWRYTLDVAGKRCVGKTELADVCLELPVTNRQFASTHSAYRYVYGCGVNAQHAHEFYNQIVKIDIANGSCTSWYNEGHYPGEPVFVPSPDSKAEDDGLLLSVVLDTYSNTSYLLILNASNLGQVAKATLPHSILFGYHGTFIHQN